MHTVDRIIVHAPVERVFHVAADVERWPEFLSHYRWVRIVERRPGGGIVEMAAWRPFGAFKYPTWWVSEMRIEAEDHAIRYRHLRGLTRGMDVTWRLEPRGGKVTITVEHAWRGPAWPMIGSAAASWVIGPLFIHHIASRTLSGVKQRVEGV